MSASRILALSALLCAAPLLQGCLAVAAGGAAVGVAGAAVGATVKVGGAVVDAAIPDGEIDCDKKKNRKKKECRG